MKLLVEMIVNGQTEWEVVEEEMRHRQLIRVE